MSRDLRERRRSVRPGGCAVEEITAWMPAEGETMRMTPEGMRSLADQMVGVKVRLYGGRFVGTVIAAEVDDVGVRYTARAD